MKRFIVLFTTLFALSVCALCSCGIGYAKVSGIQMYVMKDGSYISGTGYSAENALTVGEEYTLTISYSQSGGSRAVALLAENIAIEYDSAALQLIPIGDREYDPQYTLSGLSSGNTEVTVSNGEYSASLLLSFE